MSRDRDLKFGTQMQMAISQKPAKKNSEKGRSLGHVTLIIFGVPPNISTKRVELETSNLVHRCRVAISQKTRKEKSRKLSWPRSCDPQIFGVHPNVSPKRVEIET